MIRKFSLFGAVVAVLASVASAPAAAQATWNYATFTQGASNANNYGNSWSASQGGTTLRVTGFSNGSGTTFATANVANYGSGSGFGIKSQTEGLNIGTPQHAMDNSIGTDMLALHFTGAGNAEASVVLTSITSGWHNTNSSLYTCGVNGNSLCGTDSDISLLRWGGVGTPVIAGKTHAQLLAAGWQLVDHYSNMVDDQARNTGLNSGSAGSSWWLISAYSSSWGGASMTDGNDFVKVLASVTALPSNDNQTPEPGSMALAAGALLATMAMRRRVRTRR